MSIVIIAVSVWFLWPGGDEPGGDESAAVAESAAEPSTEPVDSPLIQEPLPALGQSDAFVRRVLGALSAHPEIARWLAPDDLIRRFAAAVDNVAEGVSPRAHLGHISPSTGFRAISQGERLVVDPDTYHRFDDSVSAFVSLDTEELAALYRNLKPLVQEAYRDLGYPRRDFDEVLGMALRRLIQTPVPSGELEVVPKVRSYSYADPALEDLTASQKDLLEDRSPESATDSREAEGPSRRPGASLAAGLLARA